MKIHQTNHLAPTVSGIGLCLLFLALCCPFPRPSAKAQDTNNGRADIDVAVEPVIAVSLSPQVAIDVAPKSNGNFATSSTEVSISTNSDNGFKILLSGIEGTNLAPSDQTSDAKISSITNPAKPSEFGDNTWGYYISQNLPDNNSTYHPIPLTASEITTRDTSTMLEKYQLSFGTRVTTALPADTYSGAVLVSAIANPITVTSLRQLTYMQQMTNDICANTKTSKENPVSKQLIDTRDGKSYWVAKLGDGRCWMTQNLAFDIKIDEAGNSNVKASDSNVAADWNSVPEENWQENGWTAHEVALENASYTYYDKTADTATINYYPPTATSDAAEVSAKSVNNITTFSWNLGKWVAAMPLHVGACDYTNPENATVCAENGIINVDSGIWRPTYSAQIGQYNNADVYSAVDQDSHTYDAHYLFGNYYEWNTATAGTGGKIIASDASGSICPKGWQLPSGAWNGSLVGTFFHLAQEYGVQEFLENTNTGYNIKKAPLYFVVGGGVRPASNGLMGVGSSGLYWSSTAHKTNQNNAQNLVLSTKVVPGESTGRASGWAVRCINDSSI